MTSGSGCQTPSGNAPLAPKTDPLGCHVHTFPTVSVAAIFSRRPLRHCGKCLSRLKREILAGRGDLGLRGQAWGDGKIPAVRVN